MKTLNYKKQRGVASLLTAVILLTCLSLVVLFTSKTVVTDTKITADNARIAQATQAAQAAMDHALAVVISGSSGLRSNIKNSTDKAVDYTKPSLDPTKQEIPSVGYCQVPTKTPAFPLTLTSGKQTTFALFYFDNTPGNRCDCPAGNCFSDSNNNPMDRTLVVAMGWSDDCAAVRTISQCVGSYNILQVDPTTGAAGVPSPIFGASPSTPITGNGNVTIVNRFTNSTITAGNPSYSISGASLSTYTNPTDSTSQFSVDQLLQYVPQNGNLSGMTAYTQLASNSGTGNGADILIADNTLGQVKFNSFFTLSLPQVITLAESKGLCFSSSGTITPAEPAGSPAQPCSNKGAIPSSPAPGSIIVTDGSIALPSPLGSLTNPVILILNNNSGTASIKGGDLFYGILYCTSGIEVKGGGASVANLGDGIVGSLIAQGSITTSGGLEIRYRPMGGNAKDSSGNPAGFDVSAFTLQNMGVINGSWRDWGN